MALQHAQPGEVMDVRPLGDRLAAATTHALLKTRSLELMRVVLRSGEGLPRHSANGEVTIQCIEGAVRIEAEAGDCVLQAGELVLLPAKDQHAVQAMQDATLLVTLQLPSGQPGSQSSTG